MSEEYVAFYQIAKEIAEEEGLSFVSRGQIIDQNAFDNYRATQRRSLIAVLKKINKLETFQTKKGDDFQIPLREKEVIKFFVRYHAEPLNKKARQAKIAGITGEEAKSLLDKFEATVLKNSSAKDGQEDAAVLAALTQAQSRYALDVAMLGLKEMWENDIGQLTWRPADKGGTNTKRSKLGQAKEKELRIANDKDAAFLIYYYHHMLLEQSRIWNELVDLVDELRTEEMMEMVEAQTAAIDLAESNLEGNANFRDVRDVLMEARQILYERHRDRLKPRQEPTKKQQQAIEELLRQHGKDKG